MVCGGGRGEEEVFDGAEDEEEGGGLVRVRWRTRPQFIRQTSEKENLSVEVSMYSKGSGSATRRVEEDEEPGSHSTDVVRGNSRPTIGTRVLGQRRPRTSYVPPLECLGHGARERIRWRACEGRCLSSAYSLEWRCKWKCAGRGHGK